MSGIQGAQGSLGPTGEGFGISSTNPDDQEPLDGRSGNNLSRLRKKQYQDLI